MNDKIIDGDKFIWFQGFWVGENGMILNANHREIKSFPSVKINGRNYRKANLIADLWMGKPTEKANITYKDGNSRNCKVTNLKYIKTKDKPIKFKDYEKEARRLTELQPIHIMKDFDKRGFLNYHIDHVISIRTGFKNNFPLSLIANIMNLQMLSKEENQNKKNDCYCVISQCGHMKEFSKYQ